MRERLLQLFDAALGRVHGTALVREALAGAAGEVALVALGKAAVAMADGARSCADLEIKTGFIGSAHGYGDFVPADPTWEVHHGGHPIPDADSLAAGAALVPWLERLPSGLPLVVLMSGGSSACIEHLREGMSLEEVAARTRALLGSGADIRALNTARSEWSQIKHGRALGFAGLREVRLLVLSDVPGDDPAFVGSGPFFVRAPSVEVRVLAGNRTAVEAVIDAARGAGQAVHDHGLLGGDAARAGVAIARELREAPSGVHVWGGDSTVILPADPGRGGRCQHLALAAALELDGCERVTLLAAGTDGIDGDSVDAGAIIDGGTVRRIADGGGDARAALKHADSNTALAAAGDLIHTGPTGTNVMDLVIAIVE